MAHSAAIQLGTSSWGSTALVTTRSRNTKQNHWRIGSFSGSLGFQTDYRLKQRMGIEMHHSGAVCSRSLTSEFSMPEKRLFLSPLMAPRNCIILLFRPKAIEHLSSRDIGRDLQARTAADSITRLVEDLLSTGMIDSGLIHLYVDTNR